MGNENSADKWGLWVWGVSGGVTGAFALHGVPFVRTMPYLLWASSSFVKGQGECFVCAVF